MSIVNNIFNSRLLYIVIPLYYITLFISRFANILRNNIDYTRANFSDRIKYMYFLIELNTCGKFDLYLINGRHQSHSLYNGISIFKLSNDCIIFFCADTFLSLFRDNLCLNSLRAGYREINTLSYSSKI